MSEYIRPDAAPLPAGLAPVVARLRDEDPAVQAAILAELPGIVNHWLRVMQRVRVRAASDPVARFIHGMYRADPSGYVARGEVLAAYRAWCLRVKAPSIGRNRFFERVRSLGIEEARQGPGWGFRLSPGGPAVSRHWCFRCAAARQTRAWAGPPGHRSTDGGYE